MIGQNLNNNQWHSVDIVRKQSKVNATVDESIHKSTVSTGAFTRLDLDKGLHLGGAPKHTRTDSDLQFSSGNYIGCLENFLFDNINILYSIKYNKRGFTASGDIHYECASLEYVPVTFQYPSATVLLPTFVSKSLSVQLSFRTLLENGLLLSKVSSKGRIYIGLKHGRLFVKIAAPIQSPINLEVGNNLDDGIWHKIDFVINSEKVSISLDSQKAPLVHNNMWLAEMTYGAKYAVLGGGAEQISPGFVGCVYDMTIDGTYIDFRNLPPRNIRGAQVDKCQIKNWCWPNPCKHGGHCKQERRRNFTCDCSSTMYNGRTCEEPIFQSTCEDYKILGLTEDSFCTIDPDGKGSVQPFEVICNVTRGANAVTIIKPEKSNTRRKVDDSVSPLEGMYFQHIKYPVSIEALAALTERSTDCRQFIRYECNGSLLLDSPRGPPVVDWVNRHGITEGYWGGATRESEKCACGMTMSCADPNKYCNCDKGDTISREDSGKLHSVSAYGK